MTPLHKWLSLAAAVLTMLCVAGVGWATRRIASGWSVGTIWTAVAVMLTLVAAVLIYERLVPAKRPGQHGVADRDTPEGQG